MESILPEPMQLDDDLDAILRAISDLRISAPKRKSAKKSRSDQCLRYRQNPLIRRCAQRQQFKQQMDDLKASRLKQKTFISLLCKTLQGKNPLNTFYTNCNKAIADWRKLLTETEVPCNASSTSPYITRAFKVIDTVICGSQTSYLLRRLAYVHLMRLFSTLEDIIKIERESGLVIRGRYYRDASVALDIYMSAQDDVSDQDCLRYKLKERKRTGRSWRDLSKPLPAFVLMYSDATERIV